MSGAPSSTPGVPDRKLEALIDQALPRARARWSSFLLLSRPVLDKNANTPARVDLRTRTITLGEPAIIERGLEGDIEALLAHEIGHLVAAPGSFAAAARLRLLERTFLPSRRFSLTLPFYELLVDERLGPSLAEARRRILRAQDAGDASDTKANPASFQRAVLEELWQRPPGDLLGDHEADFAERFPDYRADAQLMAQNLFALAPGMPLQFLYFASIAYRYAPLPGDDKEEGGDGDCMDGDPSPEDMAEALALSAAEKAAIKRALAEGWFLKEEADKLKDQRLEKRIASMPGKSSGGAELITAVMAAHYRREAERWLFRPPPVTVRAEELVPTTLSEWDPGDPVASIDWVATLLQRGETLGAAMPLLRDRIADDEGRGAPVWEGRVEIYLDVSGSMPDPKQALNAMTLAAQILALGAVRAGGSARALVYSTGHEKWWTFSRSESVLSRFLLHYIGQGTDFPFEILKSSVEELAHEQPVRIIITDRDFDSNYNERPENAAIFAEAAARSPALVLLLHNPDAGRAAHYIATGARVVGVQKLHDFPRLSAELSFALFEQGRLPTSDDDPSAAEASASSLSGTVMSFLKSWFAERSSTQAPPPEVSSAPEVALDPLSVPVDLPALLDALRAALDELDPATLDADVVRAKLADICRGLSLAPLDALSFEQISADLDRGGWDRAGLLVLVMENGALGEGLRKILAGRVQRAVRSGVIEASRGSPLLTLELLRSASLRLEELARRFVLGLGASIAGESIEASKKALERLDYNRLLTEADRAKRAAASNSGRGG